MKPVKLASATNREVLGKFNLDPESIGLPPLPSDSEKLRRTFERLYSDAVLDDPFERNHYNGLQGLCWHFMCVGLATNEYSRQAMIEYGLACRKLAIDEAAKLCKEVAERAASNEVKNTLNVLAQSLIELDKVR